MNRRTMLLANLLIAAACAMPAGATEPTHATQATQPNVKAPLISQAELLAKLDQKQSGVVVLDVRTATEFAAGYVPGARNVSHDELPARLDELAALRDTPVVLYCRSGRRSQLAADVLRKAGFTKLLQLEGDWLAWEAAKRPVEGSSISSLRE